MTDHARLAAVTLAALSIATFTVSAASAAFVRPPQRQPEPQAPSHSSPNLECRVRGTDFYIMNFGSTQIDSGRQVAWGSPSTGDSGTVRVPGPLAPGQEFRLTDVLSDDAAPGAPCVVDFAN